MSTPFTRAASGDATSPKERGEQAISSIHVIEKKSHNEDIFKDRKPNTEICRSHPNQDCSPLPLGEVVPSAAADGTGEGTRASRSIQMDM